MWPYLVFGVWKGLKCDDFDKKKPSRITQYVVVWVLGGVIVAYI